MAGKFRFGVQAWRAASGEEWAAKARRIEDLGYSTLLMPDHFDDQLAPVPALAAAAAATSTLRLGTLVFDNDFRHPVVLAKEAATLDILSGGRLELGLGAGWMRSDYDRSGIAFDPPAARIRRLGESLRILKTLWNGEAVSFSGRHYKIDGLEGTPRPVQQPHPPILVGGGGRMLLSVAARHADIVGLNFALPSGAVDRDATATGTAAATEEKVRWIREAAGERFPRLELNVTVFVVAVTNDRAHVTERIAGGFGVSPEEVLQVPHVLVGSVEQIVDDLQERRDRFGISYVVFSGEQHEAMAPVVARLAGS